MNFKQDRKRRGHLLTECGANGCAFGHAADQARQLPVAFRGYHEHDDHSLYQTSPHQIKHSMTIVTKPASTSSLSSTLISVSSMSGINTKSLKKQKNKRGVDSAESPRRMLPGLMTKETKEQYDTSSATALRFHSITLNRRSVPKVELAKRRRSDKHNASTHRLVSDLQQTLINQQLLLPRLLPRDEFDAVAGTVTYRPAVDPYAHPLQSTIHGIRSLKRSWHQCFGGDGGNVQGHKQIDPPSSIIPTSPERVTQSNHSRNKKQGTDDASLLRNLIEHSRTESDANVAAIAPAPLLNNDVDQNNTKEPISLRRWPGSHGDLHGLQANFDTRLTRDFDEQVLTESLDFFLYDQ